MGLPGAAWTWGVFCFATSSGSKSVRRVPVEKSVYWMVWCICIAGLLGCVSLRRSLAPPRPPQVAPRGPASAPSPPPHLPIGCSAAVLGLYTVGSVFTFQINK
ncbi:hypothetical protein PTTG_07693 [Puccinia triticina 1-1 BBBD Race 1]|uniref:Uncharacterized protein n=1 Tax=Puccinia triticina (isolate 1-1 / race 1 (BBBD)) TaxID=630390 RepID=A0A0C4F3L3_PUCT1|nr:hypothetical protein PTTG_07693 [Puccinia triticina 1-1 BBBD Race 1]